MDNPELRELVDAPRERLDVEYKSWLDLSDNETRAKLARHLCALANFGGGYLVFGINDDRTPSGTCPSTAGPCDQDTLSGIVKRYLRPAFQVAVYDVKSALTGTIHPVVWVPSHEAVPVCSVRGGPDSGDQAASVAQDTHYTRAPGPASVPVTTSELWAPIIRRCVLRERRALLAGLEPLLRSPGRPVIDPDAPLRLWHEAAHRRFLELADVDPQADLLKRAHYQFSYQLNVGGQELGMATFMGHLRDMSREVLELVDPGWTMFWVFDGPELAPRSVTDPALGDDEFLECSLLSADANGPALPDFWRVDPSGKATLIRPYFEDRGSFNAGYEAGTWLWPYIMAREIAEVMRHALAFAERFEDAESVSFGAEWHGLQGRALKDPNDLRVGLRSGFAESDSRVVRRTVPVGALSHNWPETTADILSVVMRMFGADLSISSQQVMAWSQQFRP